MASELEPCPFCSKTMMLRSALWPSEGDADAIIHADPTDCPMLGFSDGSADGSIIEKWNCSLSNEDDFPSDGSCVRCGSVPRNANGLCNTCLDEDAERLENTRTTPVAPVSPDTDGKCGELATVAKQHRLIRGGYPGSWQPYASPIFSDDVFETRELVTRSQAEELLAAERAKTERWHKKAMDAGVITHSDGTTSHPMRKELDDLKADNAALTARVKELEGINANLMGDDEDKPRYTTKRLKHEIARATEALEAKIASKDGWKELHDAAQVAIKERTEACNNLYKQVNDLKADNAAKDARIKHGDQIIEELEDANRELLQEIGKVRARRDALEAEQVTFNELCKLTFAIQHNPNCPDRFLIRLPGKPGYIDLKPYGDQLSFRKHETEDVIGAGPTLAAAFEKARAVRGGKPS